MEQRTANDMVVLQNLPLSIKLQMTQTRIRDWISHYGTGGVYVAFSGGKDSTVLVDIITKMGYIDIPLVYVDTGLEIPETKNFVKTYGKRVIWIKPKLNFKQVIEKYGYPFFSKENAQKIYECSRTKSQKLWDKRMGLYGETGSIPKRFRFCIINNPNNYKISHMCCNIMKKNPSHKYTKDTGRVAITGQMAEESRIRLQQWVKNGCNGFDLKIPTSNPMSFWTEQDVLLYIKLNNLSISSAYGEILQETQGELSIERTDNPRLYTTKWKRTGCMFCMFGCQRRDDERLLLIKKNYPKVYDYLMRPKEQGGLNYKEIIDWINKQGFYIKY